MKQLFLALLQHPIRTIKAHEELRYLVSGGVNAAVEYSSFLLLITLTHLLIFSNSVSFILGMLTGFILHKTWSFKGEQQHRTRHQFIGYVSLAAVNFFAGNLLISLLVHGMHLPAAAAKLISIIVLVSWTFFLTNYVIFKRQKPPTPEN